MKRSTKTFFSADEESLIERLSKIEALFAGATTAGERNAAGSALERIRRRLREFERKEKPIEYRFSMPDTWAKALFVALLRRYGLKPYRYYRQRRTTVMVNVTRSFVDDVLWPEFQELNRTLHDHLQAVTTRIIQNAIHDDASDVEEREEQSINQIR